MSKIRKVKRSLRQRVERLERIVETLKDGSFIWMDSILERLETLEMAPTAAEHNAQLQESHVELESKLGERALRIDALEAQIEDYETIVGRQVNRERELTAEISRLGGRIGELNQEVLDARGELRDLKELLTEYAKFDGISDALDCLRSVKDNIGDIEDWAKQLQENFDEVLKEEDDEETRSNGDAPTYADRLQEDLATFVHPALQDQQAIPQALQPWYRTRR